MRYKPGNASPVLFKYAVCDSKIST
ncbi:hypothetical protein R5R35_010599 [Gryllus longicercus]|uniref:Uncharacterized protein n=1 Tax=Gryllus longicercus TaxID=2509291 RepID=A0AAN9V8F5_9ORTH